MRTIPKNPMTEGTICRDWNAHANGINASLEDAFYNDRDPQTFRVSEKPVHRLMVYLAAQGHNMVEIARRTKTSPATVSTVLRQPWARERMQTEIREAGMDEIQRILKAEAAPALQRLISLSRDAESENVRLQATTNLVDRYLGKPTQPFRDDSDPDKLKEMSDDELERIARGAVVTGTPESEA